MWQLQAVLTFIAVNKFAINAAVVGSEEWVGVAVPRCECPHILIVIDAAAKGFRLNVNSQTGCEACQQLPQKSQGAVSVGWMGVCGCGCVSVQRERKSFSNILQQLMNSWVSFAFRADGVFMQWDRNEGRGERGCHWENWKWAFHQHPDGKWILYAICAFCIFCIIKLNCFIYLAGCNSMRSMT